jgi:hypothetical protein
LAGTPKDAASEKAANAIVTFLSSTLVINTMGEVSEAALESLETIMEGVSSAIGRESKPLVWTMRDVPPEKLDDILPGVLAGGNEARAASSKYLLNALKFVEWSAGEESASSVKSASVKASIAANFTQIDCFPLPKPAGAGNLGSAGNDELDISDLPGLKPVFKYVQVSPHFTVNGKSIDGNRFGYLVTATVNAFNSSSAIGSLESLWEDALTIFIKSVRKSAEHLYLRNVTGATDEMLATQESLKMYKVSEVDELKQLHEVNLALAVEILSKVDPEGDAVMNVLLEKELTGLKASLSSLYSEIVALNEEASETMCLELLHHLAIAGNLEYILKQYQEKMKGPRKHITLGVYMSTYTATTLSNKELSNLQLEVNMVTEGMTKEEESETLKHMLLASKQECHDGRREKGALEDKLKKANVQIEDLKKKIESQNSSYLQLQASSAIEKVEINRKMEVIDRLQAEADNYKTKSAQLQKQLEATIKALGARTEELEQMKKAMEAYMVRTDAVIGSLENRCKARDESNKGLKADNEKLTEHLNLTKQLLVAKTEEVQELEFQWAASKGEQVSLMSSKMEMEDRIDTLNQLVVSLVDGRSLEDDSFAKYSKLEKQVLGGLLGGA